MPSGSHLRNSTDSISSQVFELMTLPPLLYLLDLYVETCVRQMLGKRWSKAPCLTERKHESASVIEEERGIKMTTGLRWVERGRGGNGGQTERAAQRGEEEGEKKGNDGSKELFFF